LIFVVDDEPVIAFSTAEILQRSGYEALAFVSPLDALEAARIVQPDLIIADVMMPDLSGIDLAIRLKKVCPTSRVLMFSGQAKTADLLETARRNGHEFTVLPKPIHPNELLTRVRDAIQGIGNLGE
jgi:DNA-binding response OmpR family regulator